MMGNRIVSRTVFTVGALVFLVLLASLSSSPWAGDVSAYGTVPSRTPVPPPATATPVPQQPTTAPSATTMPTLAPLPSATPEPDPALSLPAELPAVGALVGAPVHIDAGSLPW